MKFGKLLARIVQEMPAEYRDKFLSYKLLKQHIFLYTKGGCQCALARQIDGRIELSPLASRVAGLTCQVCSRAIHAPKVCSRTGHPLEDGTGECASSSYNGGDDYDSHQKNNIEAQSVEFKRFLGLELSKVNLFYNSTMQNYHNTMNHLKEELRLEEETQFEELRLEEETQFEELRLEEETQFESVSRYWRRDMSSLFQKTRLLANYSYLNFAALVKILKKHDKLTGSNIRVEFIQRILDKQDSFFFTEELNQYCLTCYELLGSFPEPQRARILPEAPSTPPQSPRILLQPPAPPRPRRRNSTVPIHARGRPQIVPAPPRADYYEQSDDPSDCESSTETSHTLRRRPPSVQTHNEVQTPLIDLPAWTPDQCVYTRAAAATLDANFSLLNMVSSTPTCYSMFLRDV